MPNLLFCRLFGFLGSVFFNTVAFSQKPVVLNPEIGGFMEAWYFYDQSIYSSYNKQENSFRIRRARISGNGDITKKLAYKLQIGFEQPGARLLDAIIDYKYKQWLQIRVGQFKYPFSLEGLESALELPFVLRTESVNFIAGKLGSEGSSFRDIGVQAMGHTDGKLKLKYALALINGNGINTIDNNLNKDISGKVSISLIEGMEGGISCFFGKPRPNETKKNKEIAIGASVDYSVPFVKGLKLRTEYLVGDYNYRSDSSQQIKGLYLSSLFRLPEKYLPIELSGRWEYFNPSVSLTENTFQSLTLGLSWIYIEKNRIRINYLIRNAEDEVKGITHIQETTANGRKIKNLFLVQFIVGF